MGSLLTMDSFEGRYAKARADSFEGRYAKARADLININKLIYAAGAPAGSDVYFRIREIAAFYEREEANANPTPPRTK